MNLSVEISEYKRALLFWATSPESLMRGTWEHFWKNNLKWYYGLPLQLFSTEELSISWSCQEFGELLQSCPAPRPVRNWEELNVYFWVEVAGVVSVSGQKHTLLTNPQLPEKRNITYWASCIRLCLWEETPTLNSSTVSGVPHPNTTIQAKLWNWRQLVPQGLRGLEGSTRQHAGVASVLL